MLRIVGIQKHELPGQEFILLQNQGHMRMSLRGHVVMSESAMTGRNIGDAAHAFDDDQIIPPSLFVLLSTGTGTPHWGRTRDGAHVYFTYMNRTESIWNDCELPLHVLAPQHSYVDRSDRIEYLFVR